MVADVTYRLGQDRVTALAFFAGVDLVNPFRTGGCVDCRIVLTDAMPKYSIGVTVAWFR